MLRSALRWACLIAAFAGTPLRQAEAADDFGTALAELVGGHLVETIDDGVGDDSGETLASAALRGPIALGDLFTGMLGAVCVPAASVDSPHPRKIACWPDPDTHRVSGSARRHAWLQFFLF